MTEKSLSHYRIIEKLGQGGMGEVFLAEDTILNRQVAVKVLPNLFVRDPERLARFDREAKLLASINHPNVAAILGRDRDWGLLPEKTPFVIRELLRRCLQKNLNQRLRDICYAQMELGLTSRLENTRRLRKILRVDHRHGEHAQGNRNHKVSSIDRWVLLWI